MTRPEARDEDAVMLIRQRKSRIYFLRKFFDYPIRLSAQTLWKLGYIRSIKIALSYLKTVLFPAEEGREPGRLFYQPLRP